MKIRKELEHDKRHGLLTDTDPRMKKGFVLALTADVAFTVGIVASAMSLYYFLKDDLPESKGKRFAPVDFEENPEEAAPSPTRSRQKPELSVAPIVAPTLYGMGLNMVF